MRLFKVLGVTLLTVLALGCVASAALAALPALLELGEGEVKLEAHLTGTNVSFESAFGNITSKLFHLKSFWLFGFIPISNVEERDETKLSTNGASCNTEGQAAGVIKYEDESEPVFTSLSPLKVGILFLLAEKTIKCGTVTAKVKGSMLASYNGALNELLTSFTYTLKGSKGTPELKEYFNEAGEKKTASLLINFGLGFEKADLNVEKEVEDTASAMIEMMG